jgi:hypothetical protein
VGLNTIFQFATEELERWICDNFVAGSKKIDWGLKNCKNNLSWMFMKRHILAIALLATLTSFSATSKAANIISYSNTITYPQNSSGQEQLYFDGSAFSVAPFSANNSTSHGWNIYNASPMMGQPGGLLLWNWGNTFQWVTSGPLAKDTLLGSGSTLGGINYYFPVYSSSFSNQYWGIAYSVGGSNFNYGWVQLSYDASTTTATFLGAAINTTPNQSILVGQVPEPSALSLLAFALSGLAMLRRRRS